LIAEITDADIPDAVWRSAGRSTDGLGTGGMVTKLQAADLARRAGAEVVIAHGSETDILIHITKMGIRSAHASSQLRQL